MVGISCQQCKLHRFEQADQQHFQMFLILAVCGAFVVLSTQNTKLQDFFFFFFLTLMCVSAVLSFFSLFGVKNLFPSHALIPKAPLRDGVLLYQMSSLKPSAEGIFLAQQSHKTRLGPTHSYLNPSAHITLVHQTASSEVHNCDRAEKRFFCCALKETVTLSFLRQLLILLPCSRELCLGSSGRFLSG